MKRVMYALYYYITLSIYDIVVVDHSQAKGTHHSFQRGSSTSSDLCQMGKQSCDLNNIPIVLIIIAMLCICSLVMSLCSHKLLILTQRLVFLDGRISTCFHQNFSLY